MLTQTMILMICLHLTTILLTTLIALVIGSLLATTLSLLLVLATTLILNTDHIILGLVLKKNKTNVSVDTSKRLSMELIKKEPETTPSPLLTTQIHDQ